MILTDEVIFFIVLKSVVGVRLGTPGYVYAWLEGSKFHRRLGEYHMLSTICMYDG